MQWFYSFWLRPVQTLFFLPSYNLFLMSVLFRTWVDLLKCLSPVSRVGQRYQFFFLENTPESRGSVK